MTLAEGIQNTQIVLGWKHWIDSNHYKKCKILLENHLIDTEEIIFEGQTPLIYATVCQKPKIVKLLIS